MDLFLRMRIPPTNSLIASVLFMIVYSITASLHHTHLVFSVYFGTFLVFVVFGQRNLSRLLNTTRLDNAGALDDVEKQKSKTWPKASLTAV